MRILGIDYGDSRIGVAVSDPFGWTASGIGFIDIRDNRVNAITKIGDIVKEYHIETIVVGYPLNMNGTKGPRAVVTDTFIAGLKEGLPGIKTVKWDERLTSVEADRIMREMKISSRKKGVNDKIAAVLILQSYLDCIINKEE